MAGLFTSVGEIKKITPVAYNVDDTEVALAIRIAQENYLVAIFGFEFIKEIEKQIITNTVTPDNAFLLDNYLTEATTYYAVSELVILASKKIRASGPVVLEPQNTKQADDYTIIKNKYKSLGNLVAIAAGNYICNNKHKYPIAKYSINSIPDYVSFI